MPIKFRCNYCRQFLGISRAQAGGVVDCPTCGRSIRVPLLDGTVQPLPSPELNLQDAHLARALDELAQLGELIDNPLPASRPVMSGFAAAEDDADDENQIPQPIPEPIPIEVPIAPTPIRIDPPMQALESVPDSAAIEVGQVAHNGHEPAKASHEQSLLSELASLAPPDITEPQRESNPQEPERGVAERRMTRTRSPFGASSLFVLAIFLSGMFVERFARVVESFTPPKSSTTPQPEKPEVSPGQVTGRVTYKSAEGESRPDRGARLIVLPSERAGEVKLPVTGFRPADGEADAKVAAAALVALGGAMATADDQGRFHLDLLAGHYRILVLSHFQSRDESEALDPELLKQLSAYFDQPSDLLGRVKHVIAPLRVKGTGDVWDHVF